MKGVGRRWRSRIGLEVTLITAEWCLVGILGFMGRRRLQEIMRRGIWAGGHNAVLCFVPRAYSCLLGGDNACNWISFLVCSSKDDQLLDTNDTQPSAS
jgi:hypothetical protein